MMMAVVMGMVVVMMRPCADKASHCFVVYILRFRLFVSMIYLHWLTPRLVPKFALQFPSPSTNFFYDRFCLPLKESERGMVEQTWQNEICTHHLRRFAGLPVFATCGDANQNILCQEGRQANPALQPALNCILLLKAYYVWLTRVLCHLGFAIHSLMNSPTSWLTDISVDSPGPYSNRFSLVPGWPFPLAPNSISKFWPHTRLIYK